MRTHLGILLTTLATAAVTVAAVPAQADRDRGPDRGLRWQQTVVDADQSFRGLDAVDRRTAWVSGGSISGGDGWVWRTTDAGRTWEDVSPPGTTGLSLRDVEAKDADTAVVLSIGNGEDSRIWRTDDGGETWTETFRNTEEAAFYNCVDFYPGGRRGLAVSDPVDGKFRVVATEDGGRSWEVLPDAGMPDSTGEYNFSASGDCLVIAGRTAWFGSGGSAARVFRSERPRPDLDCHRLDAAGGRGGRRLRPGLPHPPPGRRRRWRLRPGRRRPDGSAHTRDGRTWRPAATSPTSARTPPGSPAPRCCWVTGESGPEAGTSLSTDGGRTWEQLSTTGYHTLDCTADGACWAAGGGGRVGRW